MRPTTAAAAGAALSALLGLGAPALGFDDEERPFREPPLTLPETLRGTVRAGEPARRPATVNRIVEISPAIAVCWQAPAAISRLERSEITVRFSLRRDGTVIGEPRVTFSNLSVEGSAREALARSVREALARCAPLPLSPSLGQAIAGRPIAIRFFTQAPPGKGV